MWEAEQVEGADGEVRGGVIGVVERADTVVGGLVRGLEEFCCGETVREDGGIGGDGEDIVAVGGEPGVEGVRDGDLLLNYGSVGIVRCLLMV